MDFCCSISYCAGATTSDTSSTENTLTKHRIRMNHYTDILRNLTTESVILTPNRRLSLALHSTYQQCMLEKKLSCWETPVILPVATWIESCWNNYSAQTFKTLPYILNLTQEQQLWEKVLSESDYQRFFLQISETAKLVKSARGILKQWQVNTSHHLFHAEEDYIALREWINSFESVCTSRGWIDQACLPDLVRNEIQSGTIAVPEHIYLAGFTEISPQLTALFSSASALGCLTERTSASKKADRLQRTSALNEDEEIRLCANWAKQQHEQDPAKLIGCVFPKLDQQRERVTQLFREIFEDTDKFNVSAGKPLSHYPIIHAALECLLLYKNHVSSEILFFLFSTPFVAGGESEHIK